MDEKAFERWLLLIGRLDVSQRERALEALRLGQAGVVTEISPVPAAGSASTGAAGEAQAGPAAQRRGLNDSLLGRLGGDRIESFGCPHCSSADVCRWGRASGKPRYRCATCRKTFNPLTGTPLGGCQEFRVWAGIMGSKEITYAPSQRTQYS